MIFKMKVIFSQINVIAGWQFNITINCVTITSTDIICYNQSSAQESQLFKQEIDLFYNCKVQVELQQSKKQ